eukprot:TRINITY_DN13180_c1_g1_i2.p1 TRINITY_DN13180_c1_g1~~TRINITY_DN13180_c1_g1_i2.p1  ORF type:complete len:209 (+),score=-1.78 TRINITY_DN13180_c1_g1_i2:586-1212(+)
MIKKALNLNNNSTYKDNSYMSHLIQIFVLFRYLKPYIFCNFLSQFLFILVVVDQSYQLEAKTIEVFRQILFDIHIIILNQYILMRTSKNLFAEQFSTPKQTQVCQDMSTLQFIIYLIHVQSTSSFKQQKVRYQNTMITMIQQYLIFASEASEKFFWGYTYFLEKSPQKYKLGGWLSCQCTQVLMFRKQVFPPPPCVACQMLIIINDML